MMNSVLEFQQISAKMIKTISNYCLLVLTVSFFSCAPGNEQARIRIVDLQGKPHAIATRVPELNSNALARQDNIIDSQNNQKISDSSEMKPQISATPNYMTPAQNDLGTAPISESSKSLQQTKPDNESDESIVAAGAPLDKETVEYDLAESENQAKTSDNSSDKKPKKVLAKEKAVVTKGKGKIFIQVGSFSNLANAKQSLVKMQKFHRGKVETIEGEKIIYRVLLGPFSTKQQARKEVKHIKNSGYEAIIVKN